MTSIALCRLSFAQTVAQKKQQHNKAITMSTIVNMMNGVPSFDMNSYFDLSSMFS